jgi:NitT/TauT family transport system substrate-binding protein
MFHPALMHALRLVYLRKLGQTYTMTRISGSLPRRSWLPVLALLVVVGASCAGEAPVRMRLAVDLWAGYYPAFIAAEKGWFAAEGLEVTIELPQDTKRSLAELAAGDYDAVGASLSDFFPVLQQDPGARLLMFSDESNGGDAILSRQLPGTDDAARREAVRGRKIGTNLGGFGEIFVRQWLTGLGLTADDVQLMQMDASQGPKLLADGAIDFIHTWNPYITEAKTNGGHEWFDSSRTPGLIPDGLLVSGAFLQHRRGLAAGFVRAWMQAQTWWREHPDDARVLLKKRLGTDNANDDAVGIRLLDADENRRRILGDGVGSLSATVAIYNRFFLGRGLLNHPIEPARLIVREAWE